MIRTTKPLAGSIAVAFFWILAAACSDTANSPAQDIPVEAGVTLQLAQHRATVLSNINYRLELSIPEDPDERIDGSVEITFNLSSKQSSLQLDFREKPENVLALQVNGASSDFRFESEHIVVPPGSLAEGTNTIAVEFIAGDTSLNRNPEFLYTLFVPDRARTAFPLFDQPDLKARYELTLAVPDNWVAMSNAPIAEVQQVEDRQVVRFLPSDLMSSYLFSFVAGEFEIIERDIDGRAMTMLHRETDVAKVERNTDQIFALHAAALDWLERYTGIDYPYQKFGFALIPAFQYGGMEHVGAIQYRADTLLLDESPSDSRLLRRAGLIAHETAHMWFGNLVTMRWFNDVWTKEVFANFMAAKIVNPGFPAIDHDLNFLVRHYPSAYSVDRTEGANPIRQALLNLNEAGQMYGAIIYNKAPIMMRQLESMIGEAAFREGMQEYLKQYSYANATWPALIEILDRKSDDDLAAWSEVWVNTPGRPWFSVGQDEKSDEVTQLDPAGQDRLWPQSFSISRLHEESGKDRMLVPAVSESITVPGLVAASIATIFNSDGMGYGKFPADIDSLQYWDDLADLEKGTLLINLFESMLDGGIDVQQYFASLKNIVVTEDNQLLLDLALDQLSRIYWSILPVDARTDQAADLERLLWQAMERQTEAGKKKTLFDGFANIVLSPLQLDLLYKVWSGSVVVSGLPLSENDLIDLAQALAIRTPELADEIVAAQFENTENPDNKRRLAFIAPSLSADTAIRSEFFASLSEEKNRAVESWVLDALANIHHPLRTTASERYILPSLELLQEVQVTGDIFFPKRWLDTTLINYRSATAVNTVRTFLDERPNYNQQLKMKVLQAADMMFRANELSNADQNQ